MKAELFMIHVEHDFNGPLSNIHTLPIKKVHLIDKVSYDYERECWYTFNYFRGEVITNNGKFKKKILQTGIKILDYPVEDICVYIEAPDGTNANKLHYDSDKQIWLEESRFKYKEKGNKLIYDDKDWVSGIVYSGTVVIRIETKNKVQKEKLIFLPSGISVQDYETMLHDLYRIRHTLIQRKKTNTSINSKEEKTAKKVSEILSKLEGPVHSINDNPKGDINVKWKHQKAEKPSRFHSRTAVEREVNPGKDKYKVLINYENTNLDENKMIKQQLIHLKNFCEMNNSVSLLSKTDINQNTNEVSAIYNKASLKTKTSLGDLKSANFSNAIRNLEYDISLLDTKIAMQKERILYQLNPGERINESLVNVTLECSISSYNRIIKSRQFSPSLKTTFQSGWDEEKRETHLKFNQYSYMSSGGQVYVKPNSRFLKIENCSSELRDHWMIWNAVSEAINSLEKEEISLVEIRITAQVVWGNRTVLPNEIDIFGKSKGDNYKEYVFKLASVDSVYVNNKKVNIPNDISTIKLELASYLLNLDEEVERLKTKKVEQKINLNTVQELQNLQFEKTVIGDKSLLYDEMIKQIDNLLQLPIFKNIEIESKKRLLPTQLFLHDPYYQKIWILLHSLEDEIGLSVIGNLSQMKMGVKKVEQIYEVWCLYKILNIFTEDLGWELGETNSVVEFIEKFLGKRGTSLIGFDTNIVQGSWRINFKYEPNIKILRDGIKTYTHLEPGKRTPDYMFRIFQEEKLVGNVYLDAKHKNFQEQGKKELTKELYDTSINKYGKMVPLDLDGKTIASFLVHSDLTTGMENETNGENYYSYYNRVEFPNKLESADDIEAHKYGAIYLLPSATHSFKNWFRMIMEFRIGSYQKCWKCGCEDVNKEQHLTRSGYPKYYFTCSNCNEFWVKVHCSKKGDRIIKHMNNYHRQVLSNGIWYVVCPTCGDGYGIEDKSKGNFYSVPSHYSSKISDEDLPW